ncbi:unnamed protein product [Tilletia controversa]|uniref:Alkaline ceramidase 3 n=3 Tax=Tilletia TaxID=13289 RepID=A0A8X7SZJ4_9BASI|nr:hypothetical protein CF336_g6110 [Tilletia laevis]KAE8191261.1 hypothetical protein CF328_g5733 [Tilletia controversa]KAE8253730.1 hypothetical protein A4X03_0g5816 [Tilletia caries]KAE8192275.1 hypothetical protein CF335_g5872 [Tilletia laevis]KAE8253946.1 hypothetical protein A4X06_0g1153 [Tilletia controversa]
MSWYKDAEMPTGYWGEVTATLIWCEEKYRWSKYLAEPCNALSNILFVTLAVFGARWTIKAQLPVAFIGVYLGIATIGIGSALFHSTMKYSMQVLDELPMIITSVIYSWGIFETTPVGKTSRFRILLPLSIFVFLGFYITAYFLNKENTLLHQVTYAMLQLGSSLRLVNLMSSKPSSALTKKGGKHALVRKGVANFFWQSTACFAVGFFLWNVDNIWCEDLRKTRRRIGPIPGILLEGHAWWHIFTSWGAYTAGIAGSYLMGSVRESPETFEIAYTGPFSMVPYLVRVLPKPTAAGSSNGASLVKDGKAQ